MLKHHMHNHVQPPEVPERPAGPSDMPDYIKNLFTIEPVEIVAVFDLAPPQNRVHLVNPRSSALLNLLARANLKRGTVTMLRIRGEEIAPDALARLNWWLHMPGYTVGFRGWKRANQKAQGGTVLWQSVHAWEDLKQQLRL